MKAAFSGRVFALVGVAVLVTCFSVLPIFLLRIPPLIKSETGAASYTQLSGGNWNDSLPTYSPDSQTIAFVRDSKGSDSLFIMNSDGTHLTSLYSPPDATNITSPSFDQSGSEIGFVVIFRNGSSGILEIGTNGEGFKQLAHSAGEIGTFCWSPNGNMIAYDEYLDGRWSISFVSTNDENVLSSGLNQTTYNYQYPSWGQNSTWIVFSSDLAGQGQFNIWSYNLKSGTLNQLTSGQGNATRPSISPNGDYISFVAYDQSAAEWTLWVANSNGSDSHEAVSDPMNQSPGISWTPEVSLSSYPVWNSESNGVMFFSNQTSDSSHVSANIFVYYMNLNVSSYKHITSIRDTLGDSLVAMVYGSTVIDPSWGNAGLSIVYSELDNSGHFHIWLRALATNTPKPSYG